MKAREQAKYWSPDSAAECLPGISSKAYAELWDHVETRKLSTCWTKLSQSTRDEVMAGWKALDAEAAEIAAPAEDTSGTRYWAVLSDGTLKSNLTGEQYDRCIQLGTVDGGLEA